MRTDDCPACQHDLTRRQFLRKVGVAAAVAAVGPPLWTPGGLWTPEAAAEEVGQPEALSKVLFEKLGERIRQRVFQPHNRGARRDVGANWHVSNVKVKDLNPVQRSLVRGILKGTMSSDGYGRVRRQMRFDSGGLNNYSIAFLGPPGKPGFMFMLTGRHFTLRVDGNYGDRIAFGGPIMYGHAEERNKLNLYDYQTVRANEIFKALDEKQRTKALHRHPPHEQHFGHRPSGYEGIPVSSLSKDQQALVPKLIKTGLGIYGGRELGEIERIIEHNGGADKLYIAFYREGDKGRDKLWDCWRIEGPGFVWHFRGSPHVHAYVNIAAIKKKKATKSQLPDKK